MVNKFILFIIMANTHYCYILRNNFEPHINRTYNGYTVDPKKRIRQHNQEIKGGAIYTKKWGEKSWEICAIIKGFPDHITALQCEWRIKHPAPKKIRPAKYNSPNGRITGLFEILNMERFTSKTKYLTSELNLDVWILSDYANCVNNLKPNINVHVIDKIDLSSI
jgi:predicted GIY-YIG superfamily endonuclease